MEKKIRILQLEDVHSGSELINIELNKAHMSFENMVVDTRAEFISALQQFHPDIILADNSHKSFNSMEALTIVKESNCNIPFLVVTNTASEHLIDTISRQGGKGYILKNNLDTLPGKIKDALDKVYFDKKGYPDTETMPSAEKLYDLGMLEEMDDNEYVAEIISIFLEETPGELKQMQSAAKAKDINRVKEKAHKLKSSAGLLEATKLSKILLQIEEMSKAANRADELPQLVEAAIGVFKKIERSLKEYLKTIPH